MRTSLIGLLIIMSVSSIASAQSAAELQRRGLVGIAAGEPKQRDTAGVQVINLDMNGGGYDSKIRPGDLITAVNGQPITRLEQFYQLLEAPRAGSRWTFMVTRGSETFEETVIAKAPLLEESSAEQIVEYTWVKDADDVHLRALLTKPAGQKEPLPAIILLPGLGGMPCDDTNFRLYSQLAAEFNRRGFLVWRYDQRGAGDSYGQSYHEVNFEQEVADAAMMFKAIQERPEVDRSRIYLFGFSMGGVIAPQLAAQQSGVAGLITWGTISRPLVEYMIEAAREQGTLAELGAPEVDRQVRLTLRFYEQLLSGEEIENIIKQYPQLKGFVDGGYVLGKTADYWRQVDSTLYWRLYGQSSVPVLALYGEHDFMARQTDQEHIVELAHAGGRQDVHAVIVPGVDHYMNSVPNRQEAFVRLQQHQYNFNPVAVEAAALWLEKLESWRKSTPATPAEQK
ncbi:MAG: hypothetical protein HJJLKODD_00086 [Phycisphaerae bacterium]|nr:hypothetical protein [Phycisphaerae bacterium]